MSEKREVYGARDTALMVLKEVEEGAYANLALDRVLERQDLKRVDRALATELVYGVLRRLFTLDWVLGNYIGRYRKQTSWVRNILRLAAYQLLYMDRVPDSAAVNEAVKQARRYGHSGSSGFVNGVLRNLARGKESLAFPGIEEDPVKHIAVLHSHPTWLVERWLNELGLEETISLCRSNNLPAPLTVRTNTLRISRKDLLVFLEEEGVKAGETDYAPEGLRLEGAGSLRELAAYSRGYFQVQDESSMLVGHALSPLSGEFVLDVAAAPGGKSTHLAQIMGDRGVVVALDVHPHKIRLIEENCARLGIQSVRAEVTDARSLPGKWEEDAGYVLLDAPCSGLGVLRRRPDLRWRKSPDQLGEILNLQREMLRKASKCLKPGGVLVYSTCTLLREENLDQVKHFLDENHGFEMESLSRYLPSGLVADSSGSPGYLQLYPHHHGVDGFFIARIRRKRD